MVAILLSPQSRLPALSDVARMGRKTRSFLIYLAGPAYFTSASPFPLLHALYSLLFLRSVMFDETKPTALRSRQHIPVVSAG